MDYNNISQKKKSAILEQAVLTQSPKEVAELYTQLGQVENTARILIFLCCEVHGAIVKDNFNYSLIVFL